MTAAADAWRLARRLRTRLAAELAPQLLHELRNPINAISLHTDLLLKLVASTESPTPSRLSGSLETIKKRLADLQRRQDDLVAYWLADEEPGADSATLGDVLPAVKAVLSPLLSHHECRLDATALDAVSNCRVSLSAQELHLLLVALAAAQLNQQPPVTALCWSAQHTATHLHLALASVDSVPDDAQLREWLAVRALTGWPLALPLAGSG